MVAYVPRSPERELGIWRGRVWIAPDFDELGVAATLPPHPRDGFDRMLVAQARVGSLMVVTRDPCFGRYGIDLLAA